VPQGKLSPSRRSSLSRRVTFARLAGELRSERDHTKQTIGIVIRTRSKEELVGRSVGTTALPELKGPNSVYLDWLPASIAKRPEELTRLRIKCVNPASRDVVAN
jgi:hypothetical protein